MARQETNGQTRMNHRPAGRKQYGRNIEANNTAVTKEETNK
jgi:hypothetical protein